MSKKRIRFFVDTGGLFTHGAIIFMVLSAVFTLLGSLGKGGDVYFMATGFALPLACELLFLVLIVLFGNYSMLPTALPMVLFAVFFIIRAFSFENFLYMIIFMVLYLSVAVLFTATVIGWIRNKWLVSAVILITFLFNIAVIDYPALSEGAVSVTFSAIMQEISVLFILIGLLFSSLALKNKRALEEAGLPKMCSHKVVANKKEKEDKLPSERTAEELPENGKAELPENQKDAGPALPDTGTIALNESSPAENSDN